jgi:glycosyltransferase involved in cell wall biosynthesis
VNRRVLLVSADPVGERMAGLAIRYSELARTLSAHAQVTLAHGGDTQGSEGAVRLLPYRPHAPHALRGEVARADMIFAHPQWPLLTRWLRAAPGQVVFDLYDPETFETLEATRGDRALRRRALTATTLDRLHDALRSGDRFVCASETQRDLWLGAALALRLIDAGAYDADPSVRSLIDVVPFGLPATPPPRDPGPGPHELLAGLAADAELVLWNGGLWSWLDPLTAIRAVALLAPCRPRLRLVFMGARGGEDREGVRAAQALARELGLLDRVVLFNPDWVPYAQRAAWLVQADCALSCHRERLETRFAFRTRLLDCLWAGLPIVCTAGDDLAERVEREQLGAAVSPEDPRALAAAIEQVLDRGRNAYGTALERAAADYTWPRVTAPLVRWLDEPPTRPRAGRTRGAVGSPLAGRLRSAAYLAGGRLLLDRRGRRSTG